MLNVNISTFYFVTYISPDDNNGTQFVTNFLLSSSILWTFPSSQSLIMLVAVSFSTRSSGAPLIRFEGCSPTHNSHNVLPNVNNASLDVGPLSHISLQRASRVIPSVIPRRK